MQDQNMLQIKVIHEPTEDEPFVVLVKPSGLPSAPLKPEEDCAYTQAAALFPQLDQVQGKKQVEHGLLHRIDTPTQGLLVVAATQDFYSYMAELQERGGFIKEYTALCNPVSSDSTYPEEKSLKNQSLLYQGQTVTEVVKSMFRPFGTSSREVRPVTQSSGRAALKKSGTTEYTTEIKLKKINDSLYLAGAKISKGYRHQVRSHLAWKGFPVAGDNTYNPTVNQSRGTFCFAATKIQFKDMKGNLQSFEYTPEFIQEIK